MTGQLIHQLVDIAFDSFEERAEFIITHHTRWVTSRHCEVNLAFLPLPHLVEVVVRVLESIDKVIHIALRDGECLVVVSHSGNSLVNDIVARNATIMTTSQLFVLIK